MNSTDWKLKTGTTRSALRLSLHLTALTASRHLVLWLSVLSKEIKMDSCNPCLNRDSARIDMSRVQPTQLRYGASVSIASRGPSILDRCINTGRLALHSISQTFCTTK